MSTLEQNASMDAEGMRAFTKAMRKKLRAKRAEGRHGWWDKNVVSTHDLTRSLIEHVTKGDMVDVANLAMMIWYREEVMKENGE